MPGQFPACAADFILLPPRERCIADFVDHLPDGASMDVKCLAKQLPLYGQPAVGSALRTLSVAGYLRRVRCLVGEGDQVRRVYRTFWSRTARDNEWWGSRLVPERREPGCPPRHRPPWLNRPQRLTRGVMTDYLTDALTSGLPTRVGSPVGLVRRRLADKMPPYVPEAAAPPTPGETVRRAMMECTKCGVPGRPEALPDGLCGACARPGPPAPVDLPAGGMEETEVRAQAGHVRELLRPAERASRGTRPGASRGPSPGLSPLGARCSDARRGAVLRPAVYSFGVRHPMTVGRLTPRLRSQNPVFAQSCALAALLWSVCWAGPVSWPW